MRPLALALVALPWCAGAQGGHDHSLDSLARAVERETERYADRRAASAAGYRRIGPDFPGMGEHWLHPGALLSGAVDAARPTLLIYATINGKPQLLGAGFATTTDSASPVSHAPGWPEAWHEHSGLIDDESGVAPGRSAANATHVWVLHVWTKLPNPAGTFIPDNWALPFHRLGLSVPATADADAARALALIDGGDGYLRAVLTDANLRTPANAGAIDAIIARSRTEVGSLVPAPGAVVSDEALARLRHAWRTLGNSLREQLGAAVDQYLAPPHATAHQHMSGRI